MKNPFCEFEDIQQQKILGSKFDENSTLLEEVDSILGARRRQLKNWNSKLKY